MTGTADNAHRFDWLAGVATLLAILACYGTIVLIDALSADGIAAVRTSGCLPDHGLW